MTPFTLIRVEPLGRALLLDETRGAAREVECYPVTVRGATMRMRRWRRAQALEQAAAVLGMTPAELDDLECGRVTLGSEAEWDRAEDMLRDADAEPTGVEVVARAMRGAWM